MKLRNLAIPVLLLCTTLFSCSTDNNIDPFDPKAQLELEKETIRTFAAKEYPNAIEDTTGIWYELLDTAETATFDYKFNQNGTRIYPTATVNYKLFLLNGTEVDSNQSAAGLSFMISPQSIIPAWQIAFFPRAVGNQNHLGLLARGLQPGDSIRIITPSFYAYRNESRPGLPPNSPLIFEIKVLGMAD
ncbi:MULTISPECIES: FKBP-type peptidyl-prolyl cis-trans isomerase [Sphingobacterium]|uniref:Peptidyl-prolyl cis-trans isomerase n=1 Tax=Sphingobacterium populi TaxID=1812824 RepID=A0ABW5UBE4_9SPHI|nr:FKBP-type peptidyl-prolyl cis-trans isomerase [Sphingobacterium sp. CFCC 11742]